MSNYAYAGNLSLVLYVGAFLGCSGLLALTATEAPDKLKGGLRWLSWLFLFALVTTMGYRQNTALFDTHFLAGAALFAVELWLGWRLKRTASNGWNTALWYAQLSGCAALVLTSAGVLHLLFVGEMLTSLAFGVLLVRSLYQQAHEP